VLRHQGLDEGRELVNAPLLAKERGIQLLESREDTTRCSRARCTCAPTATAESAIRFGRGLRPSPMIVRFDGLELDLEPKGALLITRHDDQPGVVGLLGTVLGSHRVNIRRIELGPATSMTPGGRGLATGVLSLYDEPSQPCSRTCAAWSRCAKCGSSGSTDPRRCRRSKLARWSSYLLGSDSHGLRRARCG
jgi:hypothetical protein